MVLLIMGNIQNTQTVHTTQYQKKKKKENPDEQIFFQGRYTDGEEVHEKMLNITNHQRNANQAHSEISLHTCANGYHQKVCK